VTTRIADLSSVELLDLVRSEDLDDFQLLEVLRSPYCTSQIAEIVASVRERLGTQAVREALAGFPGLSNARALNMLSSLTWTSLMAVAQTPRSPPLVRRQAERKLILQVHSMTLGEKVAMARRAHRALFPALINDGDPMILSALLDNPRLVENDVVVLINTREPSAELLGEIARHRKWGQCFGVRRAVAECPSSPLPLALSVLVQLPTAEQQRLAGNEALPTRLREAAAALLEREPGSRPGERSGTSLDARE
jgi:hypothetical protein